MELITVADGVHAVLQEGALLGESNSGFIASGGGLVVDTFWDLPSTQQLLDLYASVHPDMPGRLVNTHHNGDHCFGNQLVTGAEIIAHRGCAERFGTDAPPELLASLATADDLPAHLAAFAEALRAFDFAGIELTPPTTIIDGDTTIDLGDRAVELLYVGPAHTEGDVAVWLEDDGVLFTGDVLFHRCAPIGWEGSFATWIEALERLAALEPAVVVPGHGPLTDVGGLLDLRDYLVYVRAEARTHFDAGLDVYTAATKIDLAPFPGWSEHERIVFQVDRAYREFRGEPWDAPFDAIRLLGDVGRLRAVLEQS